MPIPWDLFLGVQGRCIQKSTYQYLTLDNRHRAGWTSSAWLNAGLRRGWKVGEERKVFRLRGWEGVFWQSGSDSRCFVVSSWTVGMKGKAHEAIDRTDGSRRAQRTFCPFSHACRPYNARVLTVLQTELFVASYVLICTGDPEYQSYDSDVKSQQATWSPTQR